MDAPETPHIHGTPITLEPKTLKELWQHLLALKTRVDAHEAALTEVPPAETEAGS